MADIAASPITLRPASPLIGLPVAVLDLETTGLDPQRDRIVQLAARHMTGVEPAGREVLNLLVNPHMPIPALSTAIHGIDDEDVATAPDFGAAAAGIFAFLAERVVVGHNIGFDLAVLASESQRINWPWQRPPSLCTALLAAALNPDLPDTGLETVASWLGVDVVGRHDALGDVETTAALFAAMVPRLTDAGVRTFAEAVRFQQRPATQLRRQEEAGWHDHGAAAAGGGNTNAPRIDSFLYRHLLSDLMAAPPVFAAPDATVADAAVQMRNAGIGALLVGDASAARADGIVTERDIVAALAEHGAAAGTVALTQIMSTPVETLPADAPAYRGLGRLQRLSLRHLAASDPDGKITGIVSARDLLRERAGAMLALGDEIATAAAADLGHVTAQLPELAAQLLAEDMDARDVAGVISAELQALTARAGEIAQAELAAAGKGPPPARWSLLVLGSGGRGESLLAPDQDNALIRDGDPHDTEADEWFAAFGSRIADVLDAAGIPYCQGGVMARNAEWRHTPAQWHDVVEHWIARATPDDLLNVDIFFDFRAVAGDGALADTLDSDARKTARNARPFLNLLTEMVSGMRPPIGYFGSLQGESGRIDLKRGGLLPLVSLARVAALRYGVAARANPARLAGAAAAGGLPHGDVATLTELHEYLLRQILDQQIADIAAGVPPSNKVALDRLNRREKRRLRDALSQLDDILSLVRSTLSGH